MTAFQKAHRFDENKGDPCPWLYGIAANLCRRHGRSAARAGRFIGRFTQHESLHTVVEGPERILVRQEEVKTVHRAIQKLPFKQREVFVLYELEGMEGRNIGMLLNVREGTVWTRLHHARKAFAKSVKKMVANDE